MPAGDAVSTPRKSKRELRDVAGEKRQLIETAQQLRYIDHEPLYGVDVEEFERLDGGVVRSVRESAPFRRTWEEIVDVMSVIAPVETREESAGPDGEVMFVALAAGSRRSLRVRYYGDGTLEVRAVWSESSRSSMGMVIMDEIYTFD